MLRCLIVEDEPLAARRLEGFIARTPGTVSIGTARTADEARAQVERHPVDLVLLDVVLGGTSGLELLEREGLGAAVVLVTASAEHALRGYDLRVVDYLLKPVEYARFLQAVDRVREHLRPRSSREFCFIRVDSRLQRVELSELRLVRGQDDYRELYLRDRRVLTAHTFGELERLLPADRFCRVHKSWLVSLAHVDHVERDGVVVAGEYVPVSERYRDRLWALLGHPR